MLDILSHLVQAVEKLVFHAGVTPNGMVPTLVGQAQAHVEKAQEALAQAQQDMAPQAPPPEGVLQVPPPVVEPEAPQPPPPDPTDNEADALNAAEEQGLETAAPPVVEPTEPDPAAPSAGPS